MVQKYLGKRHEYGVFDCITLIKHFYANELNLFFTLPDYPKSRAWLKSFSTDTVEKYALQHAKKVSLTAVKDYDVMVFKSDRSNLVIHFGIYLSSFKMLHIEEGGFSCVSTLSDYWMSRLHMILRHNEMV